MKWYDFAQEMIMIYNIKVYRLDDIHILQSRRETGSLSGSGLSQSSFFFEISNSCQERIEKFYHRYLE
jgi:hypothetical protein